MYRAPASFRQFSPLNGAFARRSLKTSNYERAVALIRGWETAGSAREEKPIAIGEAVAAFRRDIGALNVQEPAKRKFHALIEERLPNFAPKQGYPRLEDPNLHAVTEFRVAWPGSPLTARNNIERLRAFFRFAMDREKNPFTAEEFDRIPRAPHLYEDGHGRTGQLDADELRVMVPALRFSGLRIGDAVKLQRTQPQEPSLPASSPEVRDKAPGVSEELGQRLRQRDNLPPFLVMAGWFVDDPAVFVRPR